MAELILKNTAKRAYAGPVYEVQEVENSLTHSLTHLLTHLLTYSGGISSHV